MVQTRTRQERIDLLVRETLEQLLSTRNRSRFFMTFRHRAGPSSVKVERTNGAWNSDVLKGR